MFENLINEFSNPITAIAQIMGFIPMILCYFVFYFNNRRAIISFKMVADLLWTIHYLLLGEMTGCFINGVCTVRGLIFSQREKKKWANNLIIPIIFCIITVSASFISWEGIKSILPALGSCLAIMGFWCKKAENIRKFNFPAAVLWLAYGILTFSISTIICNILCLISIISTQIRVSKKENIKISV